MHKRYLEDPANAGFLNASKIESQVMIASSNLHRTLTSANSFFQGFFPPSNCSGYDILTSKQSKSLREGRPRQTLKIDNSLKEKTSNLTDVVPGRFHFTFVRMYGLVRADKINMFACSILKDMHIYLMSAQSEAPLWKQPLEHYNKTGILDTLVRVMNMDPKLYDYLGYNLAYTLSVQLTSLREQFDLNTLSPDLAALTYSDWDQIQRVLMTYQYGLYDKWMADLQMTRNMKLFLGFFDMKIQCLLQHGIANMEICQTNQFSYEHYMQHDINLIVFKIWFELE